MPEYLLIAFADIRDRHLQYQDLELQEIRDRALSNIHGKYIELNEHSGMTYQSLSNFLTSDEGNKITMFHYSGHSSKEGLWVQWEEGNGVLESDLIDTLFKAHKKIKLVFLNSCFSEDTAKKLVANGVSFVVGTTSKIKDKQAALVAGKFYQFLSSRGKTVKQAFDLTRDYFRDVSYMEDAAVREIFRGLNIGNTESGKHAWQLYQNDALSDDELKWSVVPSSNLALSQNKDKKFRLRIFCFYESKAEELYRLSKYSFKERGVLFNGIGDILPGNMPDPDELLQECEAADIILHILSGVNYIELWDKLTASLLLVCTSKINVAINWSNDFKASLMNLQQKGINFSELFPKIKIAKTVQDLLRINSEVSYVFENVLDTELSEFFKQYTIDSEVLVNALQEFDYYNEFLHYNNTCDPVKRILFFLIEGTENCAQILLYKKFLQKAKIERNIQAVRVPFVSTNGTITSQDQFYLLLAKELLQEAITKERYKEPRRCIEEIESKLDKEPVIILLEGIDQTSNGEIISGDDLKFRKELLANFWNNLNQFLPDSIAYRLLIFVINKSYPNVQFESVNPCERNDCWPDKILVNKLSQNEYSRWLELIGNKYASAGFKELKSYENDIVDKYREISLRKICEQLIPDEPIVEKLLKP